MAIDWGDYLVVARELNTGNKEPCFHARGRSAISRAYYSAYHAAKETLLVKYGIIVPKFNSHKFVIDQYKPINKSLSKRLEDMRDKRREADYDISPEVSQPLIDSILFECTLLVMDFTKMRKVP